MAFYNINLGLRRCFSTGASIKAAHSCKLLVVGGGSGGCAVAAKFARTLKQNEIIIVEPATTHYYQPMFTLIGGGIKDLSQAGRPTADVLPTKAKWLKDSVVTFDPKNNSVTTKKGDTIKYDFMLVAMGLQLDYNKIPGLLEGLQMPGGVCSNYSPKYVERTFRALKDFKSGNAIFTYPNTPVKCPGAPQKVCYITEDYLRREGKRDQANIMYNTSLGVIFGVKKYADALWEIVKKRDINVNLRMNLVEVKPEEKQAVFEYLDKPGEKKTFEYSMLHVTPPMSTPDNLQKSKELVNEQGFVRVNKDTMQHDDFSNIFAIGDCANSPNSKTAAAVAAQSGVIYDNLKRVMKGLKPVSSYDGYASCPLVTGYGKCILAEFDYNLTPLETFPISQDKEMYLMYMMKKDFMPPLYWMLMLNGYWNGPQILRNIMHLKK